MKFNLIGIAVMYAIFNLTFQMGQEYAYREMILGLNENKSPDQFRARIERRRTEFELTSLIRFFNDRMHHPPPKH